MCVYPHLDCLSTAPVHQPFLSLPRALTTPLFYSKLQWSCSSWITSMRELVQYRWHFCGPFQLMSGLPEFHLRCHKWWTFVIVYMYLQSFLWVLRHSFLPKKHSIAVLNCFSVPLVLILVTVFPESSCGLGNHPLSDANTLDHSIISPFTVFLPLCWAQGFR